MKYVSLAQFEKVHGRHFVYLLEQLETILEEKEAFHEGFDEYGFRLSESIEELRSIVRKNRRVGVQAPPTGTASH